MPRGKKTEPKVGRKEGSKNLQKKGNKLVNQNGVAFTVDEKKKLESLVNSATRKRKKMLETEKEFPRLFAGKQTGGTVGELRSMGKENDFVLKSKSKSLNRFKSKKEYNKYIKSLQKVTQTNYIEKRVAVYKKNYIKGLRDMFGSAAKPLIKEIKGMSFQDYMKKVQQDETLQFDYLYEPQKLVHKYEVIRDALGLPEAEKVYIQKLGGK